MENAEASLQAMVQCVLQAAQRRVVWEAAKAAGDADLFMRAKAHREAESEAHKALDRTIEAYALEMVKKGMPVQGSPPKVWD